MDSAAGESELADLRLAFDRRLKLEFHGSKITSEDGLLVFRELDDALGLTGLAGQVLSDPRTGRNGRHGLTAQFRQSVFGRLAGYEDVRYLDGHMAGCAGTTTFASRASLCARGAHVCSAAEYLSPG